MASCKDCGKPLTGKAKPVRCKSCAKKHWYRQQRGEEELSEEELNKLIEERLATMPGRKQ